MKILLTSSFLVILVFSNMQAQSITELQNSMSALVNNAIQEQNDKDHVIALASNNKTLSQKMAKYAILVALGVLPDKNYNGLIKSADEFDATLKGFREGDAKLKINKITNAEALEQLKEVENAWAVFKPNINKLIQNKKVNVVALQSIIDYNEKLLRLSHKLTQTIKSSKQINTTLNKVVEHSLKIVDRQRMLTQKMIKERLLIFAGVDPKRNRIKMQGSVRLFGNGIKGLLHGDKKRGLVKIGDEKVYKTLEEIYTIWSKIEGLYMKDHLSEKEMTTLLKYNPQLLKKSDKLVKQIEQSLGL